MKTITFTCDRCSKKLLTQVDPDDILGRHVEPANVMIFWHNESCIGSRREKYHADLCVKCTKDVIDFVKAKVEKDDVTEFDYDD